MKKKIFFILSSLGAGGAERVFWLLSQNLDKSLYEVAIVLLNSQKQFFSTDLKDVRIIDLKTIRASRSFFKLYTLLKHEKPYAVFTTGGQINTLAAFVSLFIKIPVMIARPTNEAGAAKFSSRKAKLSALFRNFSYSRYDHIICQSDEIKEAVLKKDSRLQDKIVIIPNPVLPTTIIKKQNHEPQIKKLIVAARLEKQKGHERLLDVFKNLPSNYTLTIAGDGAMKSAVKAKITSLGLEGRVQVLGLVPNILELISQHDLMVLPSYIEGFPNAVAEALSVGVPVVSFKTGGITQLIRDNLNGFIVKQNDLEGFKKSIIKACEINWDAQVIKSDALSRFSIDKVTIDYQQLVEPVSKNSAALVS